MEPVVDETAQPPTFLSETAEQPTFLTELNTDSNLSYASNQSSADANDVNSQDGSSTPATPLARKRPYRKQKGELDFLGITSSLLPASAGESAGSGGEAASDKFTAEKLFEYQWPQEKGSEHWMLQEHVQEYLDIGNFKRKHPDVLKRGVEMLERDYLRENGVVTELQCDLGLTALKASEVMDLMAVDYIEKYEEYCKVLQEKEKQEMKNQRLEYKIPQVDKSDMVRFVKKAMNSCSEFNSMFLKERKEERLAYFDMQTMNLHYPKSKYRILPPENTKPGLYPVALLPGQYQNYYKKFSTEELKYLPLSSVVHHPPRDPPSNWQDPSLIEKYSDDEEEENVADEPKSNSESESGDEDSTAMGKKSLKRKFDEVAKFTPPPKEPCHRCKKRALGLGPLPEGQRHSKKFAGMKELIGCTVCKKLAHPWCWEMTITMAKIVKEYEWQCMECKKCVTCSDPHDEEKMMFCDLCDRGYHSFCVGLHDIPLGKWECPRCNESNAEANPLPEDDDEESLTLTGRPPLISRGRGTRRARGARLSRGDIRGRGAVRGTPLSKAGPRTPARGTPKGSPRMLRGGTPRGRGSRVARGATPRGRGRGRGRLSLSSSPSKKVADIEEVQAAIDAVAAGFSDGEDESDDKSESSSSSESAEEEITDAAAKEGQGPKPVPMSLVKVDSDGAKGLPIESLNKQEKARKKEEAQEESRT